MMYKASLDRMAIIATVVLTLLFAFIIISQFLLAAHVGYTWPVLSTAGLLLIYLWCFAVHPTGYTVTREAVVINRPWGRRTIPREQVKSAERLDPKQLKGTIRIYGVGGLFGYFGRFTNKRIGSMRWYATRTDRAILLRTEGNLKFVLTPDDVEGFLSAWNAGAAA